MSLDVANIGSAEDGEKVEDENTEGNVLSELGNLCLRRRTSTNTLSDLADRQVEDYTFLVNANQDAFSLQFKACYQFVRGPLVPMLSMILATCSTHSWPDGSWCAL